MVFGAGSVLDLAWLEAAGAGSVLDLAWLLCCMSVEKVISCSRGSVSFWSRSVSWLLSELR